jgi:hypothetical protein
MSTKADNRSSLREIARRAMIDRGLDPDFSPSALQQLDLIQKAAEPSDGLLDLRELVWCSIDNDEGTHKLDVGDRLRVKLVSVNIEQGFIDYVWV